MLEAIVNIIYAIVLRCYSNYLLYDILSLQICLVIGYSNWVIDAGTVLAVQMYVTGGGGEGGLLTRSTVILKFCMELNKYLLRRDISIFVAVHSCLNTII